MSENPKISICIPVYNAENHLRRCLDSVVNQTFRDIEIVCVNDGSIDGSAAILEEYAVRDERIKVIAQENRGTHAARKRAAMAASGEFIMFLDNDDELELNTCEILCNEMKKRNCDILCFFCKAYSCENKNVSFVETYLSRQSKPLDSSDAIIQKVCIRHKLPHNIWGKIYKSSVAKNAFAASTDERIIWGEDVYEFLLVAHFSKSFEVLGKKLYKYFFGAGASSFKKWSFEKLENYAAAHNKVIAALNDFCADNAVSQTFRAACFRCTTTATIVECWDSAFNHFSGDEQKKAIEIILKNSPNAQTAFALKNLLESDNNSICDSVSFRIGRTVTWLPRKIRGVFHWLKICGFKATIWYVGEYILRKVGIGG